MPVSPAAGRGSIHRFLHLCWVLYICGGWGEGTMVQEWGTLASDTPRSVKCQRGWNVGEVGDTGCQRDSFSYILGKLCFILFLEVPRGSLSCGWFYGACIVSKSIPLGTTSCIIPMIFYKKKAPPFSFLYDSYFRILVSVFNPLAINKSWCFFTFGAFFLFFLPPSCCLPLEVLL